MRAAVAAAPVNPAGTWVTEGAGADGGADRDGAGP